MRTKYLTTPDIEVRAHSGKAPRVTISTASVDSEHDRILQDGLRFRNPLPVLYGHDDKDLPVGQTTFITRQPGKTIAEWQWLENDERADKVRNAFEQQMLGASIGFVVEDSRPNDVGGLDIRSAVAHEFSLVVVPANGDCVKALTSMGLWSGPGRNLPMATRGTTECPRALCPLQADEANDRCRQGNDCPFKAGVPRRSLSGRDDIVMVIDSWDPLFNPRSSSPKFVVDEGDLVRAVGTFVGEAVRTHMREGIMSITGRVDEGWKPPRPKWGAGS
jgi:hypothetical protein